MNTSKVEHYVCFRLNVMNVYVIFMSACCWTVMTAGNGGIIEWALFLIVFFP